MEIKFTENNLSRYAGFPLIAKFLIECAKLRELLKSIKVKHNGRTFDTVDLLLTLIVLPILGIKCIYHVNDLSSETELAKSLDMKGWCKKSWLTCFINGLTRWNFHQLRKIHEDLRDKFSKIKKPDKIIKTGRTAITVVDIDASTQSTEGKKKEKATPGYNKKGPGRDCIQWLASFCEGELITHILLEGYKSPMRYFKKIFTQTKKIIGKIDIVRIDGGFFNIDVVNWLLEQEMDILTKGRKNWVVILEIMKLYEKKDWKRYNAITEILDCGKRRIHPDLNGDLRVLIIKRKQTKKKRIKNKKTGSIRTRYKKITMTYVLLTTLWDLPCEEVWRFYLKRNAIENFFKETYQSFHNGYLHHQNYRSNLLWYSFIGLAYNLMVWFKKQHLPPWMNWCFGTIRRKLINLPGKILIHKKKIEIRLLENYSFQNILNYIQDSLNKELEKLEFNLKGRREKC